MSAAANLPPSAPRLCVCVCALTARDPQGDVSHLIPFIYLFLLQIGCRFSQTDSLSGMIVLEKDLGNGAGEQFPPLLQGRLKVQSGGCQAGPTTNPNPQCGLVHTHINIPLLF